MMATGDAQIERAIDAISSARRVGVLSGAGVSAESRIPTFRDAMEGLWRSFDPQELATPEAFARDPERVTRWYDFRRRKCLDAQPNPGHLALAELEKVMRMRGGWVTVLTQNVDGLHQRAGSRDVVELHGSIMTWRCCETGRRYRDLPEQFEEYPPRSLEGTLLRPDVVWFGEPLPEAALDRACEVAATCEVFLTVGTSSVVYPAAGFTHMAREHGAMTIEINPDETPASEAVDLSIRGRSGEVLPRIVGGVRKALE